MRMIRQLYESQNIWNISNHLAGTSTKNSHANYWIKFPNRIPYLYYSGEVVLTTSRPRRKGDHEHNFLWRKRKGQKNHNNLQWKDIKIHVYFQCKNLK